MRLSGTKTGAVNQYRGLGNQLWDLAGNRPSLDLRFADDKSLVDATTGTNLIDFTRASSGTYVGSDGLIKTATTNLLLRSEELDNASWAGGSTVMTANTQIAPNGTTTADTLTASSGGVPNLYQVVTCTPSTAYTFSFYVRLGTLPASEFRFAIRDDTNGVFIAVDIVPDVTPVTTEWRRVTYTLTTPAGCLLLRVYPYRFGVVTGGTAFLWGAQLEQSSTVGEYVKTTSTINSAPRFDHDPTTGESLGLLVEESRTNLLTYSEEFDNASWISGTGTLTPNSITSPDGTQTAYLYSGNGTNVGFLSKNINHTSGTTYTYSIYAKKANTSTFTVLFYGTQFDAAPSANTYATFNFDTENVGFDGGNITGSITPVGNGWYRCTATVIAIATGSTFQQLVRLTGVSGDVYLWGAQLEAGSFPTSYIPTEGTTVTRAADVASISGSNFSSWYRQDEGTVFTDILRNYSGNFPGYPNILSFNDGTVNNSMAIYGVQGSQSITNFSIQSGGVSQTDYVQVASNVPGPNRIGQAIATNSSILSANGILTTQDNVVTMPNGINRVVIGSDRSFVAQWGGHIRRLTYWPTRLPNETLQTITQ